MRKRGKRILFITQGNIDHASSRIRGVQYFPSLRRRGFSVLWFPRIPRKHNSYWWRYFIFPLVKRINTFRIFWAAFFFDYEILFVQRHFLPVWFFRHIRKKGRKIVYDFDDAIYISERDSRADYKTSHMIRNADLVITSSPVLAEYACKLNANVEIITSPVDTELIKPFEKKSHPVTIGWIGSGWTSKYLEPLEEVFSMLQKKYKVDFLLVGSSQNILPGIKRTICAWTLERESELISQMDIGIMPLLNREFEKGKGGYKLFQYMAARIPVVASPVGINSEIVEHGVNGFLCESKEEWFDCLSLLIEDKQRREEMGKHAYQAVLEKYSLTVCSEKMLSLIQTLIR